MPWGSSTELVRPFFKMSLNKSYHRDKNQLLSRWGTPDLELLAMISISDPWVRSPGVSLPAPTPEHLTSWPRAPYANQAPRFGGAAGAAWPWS